MLEQIREDSVHRENFNPVQDIDTIRDITDEDLQGVEGEGKAGEENERQEEEEQKDDKEDDQGFKKPKAVKNKRKMEDKVTQIAN